MQSCFGFVSSYSHGLDF